MKFPAFLPDQLPRGDVLTMAQNVIPARDGYKAAPGFVSVSDALSAAFKGGASFVSSTGVAYLLAGTANGLARLSGGSWVDLLVALSIGGRWRFTQFGDYVVCANGVTTYEVDLVAGTASAIAGAPSFIDVDVVGDHVVGTQPNGNILRVRWSAFNDHTGWTVGTNQCGEWTGLDGGEVMGIVGGEYGVILQRQRLVRMTRTGDADAPFQFDPFAENFGCASKASIARAGSSVFYLSDRGFMASEEGQAPRPIGDQKFDKSFRDMLGEDGFENVWAAIDPKNTRVVWGIPGIVGTVWIYDWSLDRASTLSLPFDGLFAGFENSTDLDSLTATYPDLDAMPYTLDDPRWSGGAPKFYMVQNGEIGVMAGANMPARIVTGEFAANGAQRTRLRAVWPETDAIAGVSCRVTVSQRRGDGGHIVQGSNMQPSGRIPLRANGKYIIFDWRIDDPSWTFIDGFEPEQSAGGLRA